MEPNACVHTQINTKQHLSTLVCRDGVLFFITARLYTISANKYTDVFYFHRYGPLTLQHHRAKRSENSEDNVSVIVT
jgi:hypothetical protein